MKLDEVFERVVVINLTFKTDRRERLLKHFNETQIVSLKNVHWEKAICGDHTPAPAWWGAGNGAWGCLMSHVRVAQDAVQDKVESYCVLEDDVIFHSNAPEMLGSFMKELPSDWGQAYLGGQFLKSEPIPLSPWVVRPHNVNRTHAFALSKKTIPHFLQHILHAPDYYHINNDKPGIEKLVKNCFHIDHQLGTAHERCLWNTYAPTWWIAGQDAGSSNISGRVNSQMWWHWRSRGNALPFFFLEPGTSPARQIMAYKYIHPGYNLTNGTLTDIGLEKYLTDEELFHWLQLIAGEAIEAWKLPGFEIPAKFPDLGERVRQLWKPGLFRVNEQEMGLKIKYPFNDIGDSSSYWNMKCDSES